MDHVPILVGQDLELDVPGIDQAFLHIQRVVAESGLDFRSCDGKILAQDLFVRTDANASAAAACRGLDHDRIADLGSESGRIVNRGHPTRAGRDDGHAGLVDDRLGPDLVAGQFEGLRSRTDEDQAGIPAGPGELPAFCQITIAGMHGLCP